jgi:energy-coupling factor transporter ATP-binding protein EcfA2
VTVVFVEHDMDIVRAMRAAVAAFYSGRVIADGAPSACWTIQTCDVTSPATHGGRGRAGMITIENVRVAIQNVEVLRGFTLRLQPARWSA